MSKKNSTSDEIKKAYDEYLAEINKLEVEKKSIINKYVLKVKAEKRDK